MKEESFTEMSLTRLTTLKKAWTTQAASAEDAGNFESATKLRAKLRLVDAQLELRRNENLNDLFD